MSNFDAELDAQRPERYLILGKEWKRKKRKEICYRTRHDGFGYRTDQGYKLMPLGF